MSNLESVIENKKSYYQLVNPENNSEYIDVKTIMDYLGEEFRFGFLVRLNFSYQQFNCFSNTLEYIFRAPFKLKEGEFKQSLLKSIVNIKWSEEKLNIKHEDRLGLDQDMCIFIFKTSSDKFISFITILKWYKYKLETESEIKEIDKYVEILSSLFNILFSNDNSEFKNNIKILIENINFYIDNFINN